MSDAALGAMAAVGNSSGLLLIVFLLFVPALLVVGGIFLYFIVLRFDAYAEIEFGYESKNDLRTFPMKYSKDRNFLMERKPLPFAKGKLGIPIPITQPPIRFKSKPLYRFYSPEPGIYIPVSLAMDRQFIVDYERDENGKFKLDAQKKQIPIFMPLGDLIPKVGFDAKQAYAESYAEADKLFKDRAKFMQMMMQWGPIIIMFVLMMVIIIQLSMLTGSLSQGVTISVSLAELVQTGEAVTATAPFFT